MPFGPGGNPSPTPAPQPSVDLNQLAQQMGMPNYAGTTAGQSVDAGVPEAFRQHGPGAAPEAGRAVPRPHPRPDRPGRLGAVDPDQRGDAAVLPAEPLPDLEPVAH